MYKEKNKINFFLFRYLDYFSILIMIYEVVIIVDWVMCKENNSEKRLFGFQRFTRGKKFLVKFKEEVLFEFF